MMVKPVQAVGFTMGIGAPVINGATTPVDAIKANV